MLSSLTVPFHRQNTNAYCGPACVQMVLADLSPGLVGIGQRTHCAITSNSTFRAAEQGIAWSSYPDGIARALNARTGRTRRFVLYCSRRAEDLTQVICLAIHQQQVPPVVLFYDAEHWIVARGFVWQSAAGAGGPYQVVGFYVHDPWPNLGTDGDIAHLSGDDCGSGRDQGWPARYITIAAWYKYYVTGVQRPSRWQGLYLAIGPEVEIPAHIPIQVCTDAGCSSACTADAVQSTPTRRRDRRSGDSGGPPVSRDEAQERALELLSADDLELEPAWPEALAESAPIEPLLVERRTGEPEPYYLVPFVTEDGRVPLLVILDAATGELLETVAMPGATTHRREDITLDTLYERQTVVLADTGEEVTITDLPDVRSEVTLVWRPSAESRSPFWPFYEAAVDDTRSVYIRIDGQAFSELHEAVP